MQNGTDFITTPNPWEDGTKNVAPFDRPFYLIMSVAVGGTSGWFPDSVGGKPWFDSDPNAMYNFASAQDQWAASWPSSSADRAMRV